MRRHKLRCSVRDNIVSTYLFCHLCGKKLRPDKHDDRFFPCRCLEKKLKEELALSEDQVTKLEMFYMTMGA